MILSKRHMKRLWKKNTTFSVMVIQC